MDSITPSTNFYIPTTANVSASPFSFGNSIIDVNQVSVRLRESNYNPISIKNDRGQSTVKVSLPPIGDNFSVTILGKDGDKNDCANISIMGDVDALEDNDFVDYYEQTISIPLSRYDIDTLEYTRDEKNNVLTFKVNVRDELIPKTLDPIPTK